MVTNDRNKHFGTTTLKGNHLPARFLAATGCALTAEAKRLESERRRIGKILEATPPHPLCGELVKDYRRLLDQRHEVGRTSIQSVRLALRAAVGLLCTAAARGHMPPTQGDLDAYLRQCPGQRASVLGFVRVLEAKHAVDLAMPPRRTSNDRATRKRLETELIAALRQPDLDDNEWQRLIGTALRYFHGVPARLLPSGKPPRLKMSHHSDGVTVLAGEKAYWLPIKARESRP